MCHVVLNRVIYRGVYSCRKDKLPKTESKRLKLEDSTRQISDKNKTDRDCYVISLRASRKQDGVIHLPVILINGWSKNSAHIGT